MFSNPLYHLSKTDEKCIADLKPQLKITIDGKSYALIACDEQDEKSTLHVNSRQYTRRQHHLSIYEKFSEKDHCLSPLHYTADYVTETHDIIVHVYLDETGGFLDCQVRKNDAKKTLIRLKNEEKETIKTLIAPCISPILKYIFERLFSAQKLALETREIFLTKLEEQSHIGTTSVEYCKLLKQTISAVRQENRLTFQPSEGVENFLQRYLAVLTEKPKKKKKKKKKQINSLPSKEIIEEKVTLPSDSQSLADEKKPQPQPTPDSVDALADKEKILYQQLANVPANNIAAMFKINKELDGLEQLRQDTLVQACINGEQKPITRYLREKDFSFNLALISTCVYHNQPKLFDYLYKRNKLKGIFCVYLYIKANPTVMLITNPSHLYIACEQGHLSFFSMLLTKYNYDPNTCSTLTGLPLLTWLVEKKETINYTQALLKAGANPNLIRISMTLHHHEKKILEEISLMKKKEEDHKATALHTAAFFGNLDAVKLLIEYKADTTLRDSAHFTPFGKALFPKGHILNEDIIKTFLKKGHKIDERQSNPPSTALHFACFHGAPNAVKILLDFKADPCAKYKNIPLISHSTAPPIMSTPLSLAATKGFTDIVKELLQHQIPSEEIVAAIKMCRSFEMQEILKKALQVPTGKKVELL